MNPRQAAEYRDEMARMVRNAAAQKAAEIRTAERARPKRRYRRRAQEADDYTPPPYPLNPPAILKARSDPRVEARDPLEAALTERLLAHVCAESVIDREQHALGVARMLRNMGAA